MVKKSVFKIGAIFLSLLVLLSTISWTVDKHLCMGRIMDVSIFHEADSCGMEEAMAVIETSAVDHHCCDNESFTMVGQDDLRLSSDSFDVNIPLFLIFFSTSYLELFTDTEEEGVAKTIYPPPFTCI